MTSEETTEAIMNALRKLEPEDQAIVYDLAVRFQRNLKKKYPGTKFGLVSAIEVIACVGIGINDNTIRFRR